MTSYVLARCAVCGSADATELAGPEEIRRQSELLWEFHMRRLSPRTPPERLVDRVAFSQAPPWRVVRCAGCGLVYRNPAEKNSELRATYAGEAPRRETLMALHHAQVNAFRAQAARVSAHASGRRGLEVGSYVGAFLAAARREGWTFEGLDVNAEVNRFVRSLGLVAHDGDLESFRSNSPYGAVVIWNTFDQLPDPRTALLAAHRLLSAGGLLAIRVPNGECYARWAPRLRRRSLRPLATRVLAQNNLLGFPYRYGFTPPALERLLRDAGFVVTAWVADVLVPTGDQWTKTWARWEERVAKPLTRIWRPWVEVYAQKGSRSGRA